MEDFNALKIKVNNLESLREIDNSKQKTTSIKTAVTDNEIIPTKKLQYSTRLKNGLGTSKEATKQINIQDLQNTQMKIMNEVINLEPRSSKTLETNLNNIVETELSENRKPVNTDLYNNQWTTKIKKRKKTGQIGSAEINAEEEFEGSVPKKNKKIWLFISKAKSKVTQEVVKKYIARKSATDVNNIYVKSLDLYKKVEDNNSFMVGLDPELHDLVYDSKFWPSGIMYDRFDFKKGRRFLDNTKHQSNLGQAESETPLNNAVMEEVINSKIEGFRPPNTGKNH